MSDLAELLDPYTVPTGDTLNHVVCCEDGNTTLCNTDAADLPWNDEAETTCLVCDELEPLPCEQVCPLLARRE